MYRSLTLLLILSLNAQVVPLQNSSERDIQIPVADVRVEQGEVLVDIAFEAKTIEVVETLEMDLVRLLKKAAAEFPDSATIRLLIANRGEKICELAIPTETVAKAAAKALSDEAMLAQAEAQLFIHFQDRISAEQEPGSWARFSDGGFFANFEAARMEDEWKSLDESPAEEDGEGARGDVEPAGEESGQVPGWEDLESSEAPAGSDGQPEPPVASPPLKLVAIVLGGIALVVVIVAAGLIRRRRIK